MRAALLCCPQVRRAAGLPTRGPQPRPAAPEGGAGCIGVRRPPSDPASRPGLFELKASLGVALLCCNLYPKLHHRGAESAHQSLYRELVWMGFVYVCVHVPAW